MTHSFKKSKKYICEYIWIGGNGELRSKTRVIHNNPINIFDDWSYDASSTDQAYSCGDTEGILKPCKIYRNPLKIKYNGSLNYDSLLILCEAFDKDRVPLKYTYRTEANKKFDSNLDEIPWFGLEQEYFIRFNNKDFQCENNNSSHYCGYVNNSLEKKIVEKHLEKCIEIGLQISGINSEVSPYQWEFQIGPSIGINAADELIIARYLLERIAEDFNATINYHPKPNPNINGSGCHINFSTKEMRSFPKGLETIKSCMSKLERRHKEHMDVYGINNQFRLTGRHETSDINKFTYGIGTRNTSVRIPNQTFKDNCGYFEDRRPASNIDPYQATSIIFQTCCIE